ncbi:hypothetical protein [Microbulbifer yueqingensis]|uniref:Uncharacterized protein n=1 Tax=Microbulbifer yueqingensis TaxID=658219 RepID=A0A1G9DXK5_9GAMM|nr:hypothetical protein [Microbulbifer yueqingensis]SDK68621.1 hypothetical protein SAMN05216212_2935 [Microbulbifer yueqingensis]
MFDFLKSGRFSAVFAGVIVAISALSLIVDLMGSAGIYWFQRSGALIVLAGVELQYAKLTSLWQRAVGDDTREKTSRDGELQGRAVDIKGVKANSEELRAFALRLHGGNRQNSATENVAFVFIILGTLIWGYGDVPFR